MSFKLEPVIWLRVLVTLAYMKRRTDVRTDVHDVMAIKPNFLTSISYHIFLAMVLRTRAPSAPSAISIRWLDFPRSPQTTIEPVERFVTFVSCAADCVVRAVTQEIRTRHTDQWLLAVILSLLGELVVQVVIIQQTFNA